MGFLTELGYKRDELNEKLRNAPWWVWVAIGAVLLLIILLPLMCTGGADRRVSQAEERALEAEAHLREAYTEIVLRLSNPRQRPDIAAITKAIVQEKGPEFFRCPVSQEPYSVNPDARAWLVNVPERTRAGTTVPGEEILMLMPALPSQHAQGIAYVGLKPRTMPVSLGEGEAPQWLPNALTPGG